MTLMKAFGAKLSERSSMGARNVERAHLRYSTAHRAPLHLFAKTVPSHLLLCTRLPAEIPPDKARWCTASCHPTSSCDQNPTRSKHWLHPPTDQSVDIDRRKELKPLFNWHSLATTRRKAVTIFETISILTFYHRLRPTHQHVHQHLQSNLTRPSKELPALQ